MANTIDTAFIKQFETEVHMAYQRMGSKLRGTVRTAGNVRGSVVRFQKIGAGSANTKSRNGNVTPMELAHTTVEATMADYYAPEYIDKKSPFLIVPVFEFPDASSDKASEPLMFCFTEHPDVLFSVVRVLFTTITESDVLVVIL